MGGFSSVTGQETVMNADNCSFDGTKRGGVITADGQLYIGNAVSPRIRPGVLTSPDGSVTIGYSAPNITLQVTGVVNGYVQIDTTDSPYVVLADDRFISCDSTAGPITIELPDAPTTLRTFVIKDRVGQAAVNNLIVTTVGGIVLIDGLTSQTLSANFESIQLIFNGTSYEVY